MAAKDAKIILILNRSEDLRFLSNSSSTVKVLKSSEKWKLAIAISFVEEDYVLRLEAAKQLLHGSCQLLFPRLVFFLLYVYAHHKMLKHK